MAVARCMRDGTEFSGDSKLEEALLCLVLTNAVEVQVNGGSALGIAVYDWCFSWINHSCSPNACYRFLLRSPETPQFSGESRLQIIPGGNDEIEIQSAVRSKSESIEVKDATYTGQESSFGASRQLKRVRRCGLHT